MELWKPPPGMAIEIENLQKINVEWLLWFLLAAVLISTIWLTTVISCAAGTLVLTKAIQTRTPMLRRSEPPAAPEANVEELPVLRRPETKQEAEPTKVDEDRIDQKPTDTPTAEKENNKTGTTVTRRS